MKKIQIISPERAASLIPVFISSFISVIIISVFVFPKYLKSNKINLELKEYTRKKNKLQTLKKQYETINEKFEKLNLEKSKIIDLISGTTNLNTFLSKLGEIANKNNIKFISIVPTAIIEFKELPKSTNKDNQVIKAIDPLLVEGLKKYSIDLSFDSSFQNLLIFLRDLEFQENIILFKDININLIEENKVDTNNLDKLNIKLNMFVYGRK